LDDWCGDTHLLNPLAQLLLATLVKVLAGDVFAEVLTESFLVHL
jgi:hypothetical protein